MGDHKRRVVTCDEEDIISNMPQDLIDNILECLPIKDAVRTSVLSKRWRYKWTKMSTLALSDHFSKKLSKFGAYHPKGFIRTINQIMIHHNGPIRNFYLHIPRVYLDSFQDFDQWTLILSRNSVRELTITNSNRIYRTPSSVFSCQDLRKLGLHNCVFKPPLEFHGFPNLEELSLKKVDFGYNIDRTVINLPQLKTLALFTCVNVNNFGINAGKLQILWVVACPDAMLLRLLDSEHLDQVRICMFRPVHDHPRVERFNLETMLSKLPNIVCFTIDGYFLKFLAAEKFPKWLPHPVTSLRGMDLLSFSFGDLEQVQGALCMLRNSPNLHVLCLTHAQMGRDADLESTSNYLESLDCLQTSFKLRKVEITSLEGSKPELLFIKLLLNNSRRLKDMTIQPRVTADAWKRLNIAKDVMMFPRASKRAKVVYLDPQPRFYKNI